MNLDITKLKQAFTEANYKWNDRLNIIGIRTKNVQVNKFDDYLVLAYVDSKGIWQVITYLVTTDPGLAYMKKLLNVNGTGALVHGQYDAYSLSLHQGKYEALCQRRANVNVYRDKNRDDKYDYIDSTIESGMFGVNIHHAGEDSINVDNWSAACTVFKRKKEFEQFRKIINTFKAEFDNKFTYTLFDVNKQTIPCL